MSKRPRPDDDFNDKNSLEPNSKKAKHAPLKSRWNVVKNPIYSNSERKEFLQDIRDGDWHKVPSSELNLYLGSIQNKDYSRQDTNYLLEIMDQRNWATFKGIATRFTADQYQDILANHSYTVKEFIKKRHASSLNTWLKLLASDQFNTPLGLAVRGEWREFEKRLNLGKFKPSQFRKKIRPLDDYLKGTDIDQPNDSVSVFSILFDKNKLKLLNDLKEFLLQYPLNALSYISSTEDVDKCRQNPSEPALFKVKFKKDRFYKSLYGHENFFHAFKAGLQEIINVDDLHIYPLNNNNYEMLIGCMRKKDSDGLRRALDYHRCNPEGSAVLYKMNKKARSFLVGSFFDDIQKKGNLHTPMPEAIIKKTAGYLKP